MTGISLDQARVLGKEYKEAEWMVIWFLTIADCLLLGSDVLLTWKDYMLCLSRPYKIFSGSISLPKETTEYGKDTNIPPLSCKDFYEFFAQLFVQSFGHKKSSRRDFRHKLYAILIVAAISESITWELNKSFSHMDGSRLSGQDRTWNSMNSQSFFVEFFNWMFVLEIGLCLLYIYLCIPYVSVPEEKRGLCHNEWRGIVQGNKFNFLFLLGIFFLRNLQISLPPPLLSWRLK